MSLISSVVILIFGNRIVTTPTELYLSEHKELFHSWSVKAFTDVKIRDARAGCQDGFENILYRVWGGTKPLCLLYPSNSPEYQ